MLTVALSAVWSVCVFLLVLVVAAAVTPEDQPAQSPDRDLASHLQSEIADNELLSRELANARAHLDHERQYTIRLEQILATKESAE